MNKEFLEAGKIVNTHGVRGEVRITPWADSAAFLRRFSVFYIDEKPVRGDDGAELGTLADVLELPQGNVYVVRGEREILIPDVPAFVLNIDPESGLTVHLIEGM